MSSFTGGAGEKDIVSSMSKVQETYACVGRGSLTQGVLNSRLQEGEWGWPWLHMTPLEYPDLLWEVVVLGPQVMPGRGK